MYCSQLLLQDITRKNNTQTAVSVHILSIVCASAVVVGVVFRVREGGWEGRGGIHNLRRNRKWGVFKYGLFWVGRECVSILVVSLLNLLV